MKEITVELKLTFDLDESYHNQEWIERFKYFVVTAIDSEINIPVKNSEIKIIE